MCGLFNSVVAAVVIQILRYISSVLVHHDASMYITLRRAPVCLSEYHSKNLLDTEHPTGYTRPLVAVLLCIRGTEDNMVRRCDAEKEMDVQEYTCSETCDCASEHPYGKLVCQPTDCSSVWAREHVLSILNLRESHLCLSKHRVEYNKAILDARSDGFDVRTDTSDTRTDLLYTRTDTSNTRTDLLYTRTDTNDTTTHLLDTRTDTSDTRTDLDGRTDTSDTRTDILDVRTDTSDTGTDLLYTRTDTSDTRTDLLYTRTDRSDTKTDLYTRTDASDTRTDILDVRTGTSDTGTDLLYTRTHTGDTRTDILDVRTDTSDTGTDLLYTRTGTSATRADLLDLRTVTSHTRADLLDVMTNSSYTTTVLLDVRTDTSDTRADLFEVSTDTSDIRADLLDVSTDTSDTRADLLDVSTDTNDIRADLLDVSTDTSDTRADLLDVSTDTNDTKADLALYYSCPEKNLNENLNCLTTQVCLQTTEDSGESAPVNLTAQMSIISRHYQEKNSTTESESLCVSWHQLITDIKTVVCEAMTQTGVNLYNDVEEHLYENQDDVDDTPYTRTPDTKYTSESDYTEQTNVTHFVYYRNRLGRKENTNELNDRYDKMGYRYDCKTKHKLKWGYVLLFVLSFLFLLTVLIMSGKYFKKTRYVPEYDQFSKRYKKLKENATPLLRYWSSSSMLLSLKSNIAKTVDFVRQETATGCLYHMESRVQQAKYEVMSILFGMNADLISIPQIMAYPLMSTLNRYLTHIQNSESATQEDEMCYEVRRFQSYNSVPVRASPMRLAQSGFYATGSEDETRCYSCRETYRSWRLMDQPDQIHRSISPDCPHLNRRDERNIPIGSVNSDDNTTVNGVLREYQTSCFTSASQTEATDVAAAAAPVTPVVSPAEPSSQSLPGLDISKSVYPQYRELSRRLDSYQGWGWSHVQDPEVLARAGFYYAGYRDCVRCFHCGVGLRTWEREDDPWVEHVRWRTSCDYIRVMKGEHFVIEALTKTPSNTASPPPPPLSPQNAEQGVRESGIDVVQKAEEMGFHRNLIERAVMELTGSRNTTRSRDVIQLETLLEKLFLMNEDVQTTVTASSSLPTRPNARSSGNQPTTLASEPEARTLQDSDTVTSETMTSSVASAADDNMTESVTDIKAPGSERSTERKERNNSEKALDDIKVLSASDERQLEEENQSMRDESTCKICMDNPSCIVFLPCGHLVTCAECAPALRKCPICRAVIRGTVRAYTASSDYDK